MAIMPILRFGNPVLRGKSKRVTTISGSVQKLIDDMTETLESDPNAAGLAAPQVGKLLRVIIINNPDAEDEGAYALVNPEIVKKTGERIVTESCLSFPGYRGEIKRAESVICKGLDRHGKAVRIKGTDFMAQLLEHEIDHLNGVLYVDHLESEDKLEKIEPDVLSEL